MNTAEQQLADRIYSLKARKVEIGQINVMFRSSAQNEELVKTNLELTKLYKKHYTEPEIKPMEMLANNE